MRLYSESALTAVTGMSREELRAIRQGHLKKMADWKNREPRGEVVWTEDGLRSALLADLIPSADYTPAVVAGPEKKQAGLTAVPILTIKRIYPNPRLLLATLPNGIDVRVQVNTNANFRPRMKIKATPINESGTLYRLVGRCPRFPGRF